MGRIVRRFARFYEQEMRGNWEQGLWGAGLGIDQYEADQVLHSSVLCTTMDGDPVAGYVGIHVNLDHTGDISALRVRNTVDANIVLTGYNYGIHLEQEILGATGEVTGNYNALQIEQFSPSGVAVGGSMFGVRINNAFTTTPTGDYCFMRCSEGSGADVTSAFMISVGGTSDILNLFTLPGAPTAWNAAVAPPGAQVGRIAVMVGPGVQLYIPLWN